MYHAGSLLLGRNIIFLCGSVWPCVGERPFCSCGFFGWRIIKMVDCDCYVSQERRLL